MNQNNVVKPSLNLNNIPDELKGIAKHYERIRRFIDEYINSPDFKEVESIYEELSAADKITVSKWAIRIHAEL